jgi:hypothetical protein
MDAESRVALPAFSLELTLVLLFCASDPAMNELKSRAPLVSAAELDALLRGRHGDRTRTVDVFLPLRLWILLIFVSIAAVRLLFFTEDVAALFAKNHDAAADLAPYLYFRGWYLVVVTLIGVWSYTRSWYTGLVFGGLLLSSSVNFLFDAFSVYSFILTHPTPGSTAMLLIRVLLVILGVQCFRASGRLPEPKDRWNPLLFLKKPALH